MLANLCEEHFSTRKPLYRFSRGDNPKDFIEIHPEWLDYIKSHHQILHGWASWKFVEYMQGKNPSVPGIVNKIFPPKGSRKSMGEQKKFWVTVISHSVEKINCIYSGREVNQDNLSLDHFLPWRFVAHNQLWNLIPVPKDVNSSKSDRIPDESYLSKLIKIQHQGLIVTQKLKSDGKLNCKCWDRYVEPYIVDLQFSEDELLNFDVFSQKYLIQIKSRMALALSYGFEGNWIYSKSHH